jgi:hypothetical protein
MPYKTTLRHFTLRQDIDNTNIGQLRQFPVDFKVIASNDDTNWTTINTTTGVSTPAANDPALTVVVNANTSYKYYAIVVEKISAAANSNRCQIGEWRLFTETFTVDAGVVSTTAASGLDVGYTEHPVEPMTDYKTYVEGHGTYEASASSYDSTYSLYPWRAFDNNPSLRWTISTDDDNYNVSTGEWDQTAIDASPHVFTSDVGGTRYHGHWLQIKLPYAITLSHSNVHPTNTILDRPPKDGVILGSNDGDNWYKLTQFTGKTYTSATWTRIDVNATTPYQYFRMCATKNGGDSKLELTEWRLFAEKPVTRMENVHISGELSSETLQTGYIKWPKVPLKANESEGYVVTASSEFGSTYQAFYAFDDQSTIAGVGTAYAWVTPQYTFDITTGDADSANCATFDNLSCEWIQLQSPNPFAVSYFDFDRRETTAYNSIVEQETPREGYLYASNDGVTWTRLTYFSNLPKLGPHDWERVNVGSNEAYMYYRLVVTKVHPNGTGAYLGISNLRFFEAATGVGAAPTSAKLQVAGSLGMAKGAEFFAGDDVVLELPKHDRPLVKYPEVKMTANSSGGYVASASSTYNAVYSPYEAFNQVYGTELDMWVSQVYKYNLDGTADTANVATFQSVYGEYVSLNMPKKIKLEKIIVHSRNNPLASSPPENGRIYGSNDNSTWTQIATYSGLNMLHNDYRTITVNASEYYKDYTFQIEKIKQLGTNTYTCIAELEYWGYEEGDTSVDVVHRSIPNKPGQQHLAVYWDANDSNSYSFADSDAVFDLSGSGVTGTITGNNGFDAEYNAWEFDGSGDYIQKTNINSKAGNWIHSMTTWIYFNEFVIGKVFSVNPPSYLYGGHNETSAFYARSSGFIWDFGMNNNNTTTLTPQKNKWYHIALVHDGTGYKKMYIDNVLQTSFSYSNNTNIVMQTGATLNIGEGNLNGKISNFRLFDKALSAEQVRELYEYDAPRFGHRQNLVALHKGNLGVGVAHPTSRFEVAGADGLQEYPPRGITQPGSSYVGYRLEEYIEGHGQYVIDGTATYNTGVDDRRTWSLFDKGTETYHGSYYFTTGTPAAIDEATTTTNNSANLNFNTKLNSGATIFADWAQIELPHKILLKRNIVRNHNILSRSAAKGYIVASNDGITFDVLNTIDDFGYTTTYQDKVFETTTNTYYRIFRILFTHKVGGDDNFSLNMNEWRLFGTPAPSSLEDGHLTLGKALTLPRVSGHATGAETPRAESLVLHYDTTVDSVVSGSTVVDISGNGLNGTLTNGAAYSSTDRALTFDGTGDYIQKSSPSGLPTGDAIYSISAWVNIYTYSVSSTVLAFGSAWACLSMGDMYIKDNGKLSHSIGCNQVYTTNQTITSNTWHHAVVVKKGTGANSVGNIDLYVDGLLITDKTVSGTATQNIGTASFVTVGAGSGANEPFNGSISNPKLWNVALTAEEVAAEYALGRTGKSINLTDTALCLGGTAPRAQLDVRGGARFEQVRVGSDVNIVHTDPANPRSVLHLSGDELFQNTVVIDCTATDSWNGNYGGGIMFRQGWYSALPTQMVSTGGIYGVKTVGNGNFGGGLAFYTNNYGGSYTEKMRIKHDGNVGFGTVSPVSRLHHKQASDQSYLSATLSSYQNGAVFERSGTSDRWTFAQDDVGSMCFFYNTARKGYLVTYGTDASVNFTGQHRTFIKDIPYTRAEELEGLIVSADNNKYIKMSGGIEAGSNAITTNESLPVVSLSTKVNDKKCFGVISASEDPEKRQEVHGNFVSDQDKELGDTRVYINSVGEGAMWVTDINGPLESGDYITTSNVAGYGQRQDDDVLHNYTVAKITMDCDFNPPDIPVQRILKELANVTYWYQLEDATSNAYDRTQEETYWTVNRYTEVPGRVDEQSNVFVSPDHDLELYTKTRVNVITAEVWEALPEGERAYYSETDANTFAYTQTIQISPETWDDLSPEEQNTYVHGYYDLVVDEVPPETSGATQRTRTLYKKKVNETTEEPENPEEYLSEVRQEWVNVLDEHGQLQWEDVPWGATEKAYNIRYLDANGGLTTRHNAVHTAAFVGVTYHCG